MTEQSNRKMSQRTYDLLKQKKLELEKSQMDMGAESSGHQRASMHDDAGAENAKNLVRGNLARIGDLKYVDIIKPRWDTSTVGLGNEVEVLYKGEDETERYLVLGYDDNVYRDDLSCRVITPESPIGSAVMGKRVGENANFRVGDNNISVQIKRIDKGSF